MATHTDTRAQVEHYLLRLRSALGRMPDSEKAEILSDIRNHIEERLSASSTGDAEIVDTLTALGRPELLAASFHRERLMARAATSPEPAVLLRATFQWALTGIRGFLAFLVLLFGYSTGLAFLACALLKPFMPHNIGMWLDPPAFSLGYISPESRIGRELLGWWIVPLGFVMGSLLLILTTRLVQRLIRRHSPAI